jgi:hypothetical protein
MMRFFSLLSLLFFFFSCKEAEIDFQQNQCKQLPVFVSSMGFTPNRTVFSTSDIRRMGLVLIENPPQGAAPSTAPRIYQHPSWASGGWLAPILIDSKGDLYTAPAPFINILNNPLANNNTLYRVDGRTGVMETFMKLPLADSINPDNPFGIIGITYLCETGTLYVSTLAGSRRHEEKGHIYAIDLASKTIIDQIDNADVMGMGITYRTGQRLLLFGTGRSSDVLAIALDKKGKFNGAPQPALSLANLGPRGDDKVRRINTDQFGNIVVVGIEFNYNLIAPSEKQETAYKFIWNEDTKQWHFQP